MTNPKRDERFIKFYPDHSYNQCAKHFKVDIRTIFRWRLRLGLPAKRT